MEDDDGTPTIYEQVGGMSTFRRLANDFYTRVAEEPVLRPLYPADLEEPAEHLALFMGQFFGGPETYSERRGHPRLRARHLAFPIGREQRDAWLKHMLEAVDAVGIQEPAREELRTYFRQASLFLMNQD